MRLSLRKFLAMIGLFALLMGTVLNQWRLESIKRYYGGAIRLDSIPDLVTFQSIRDNVSLVSVGEGTELRVSCISHKSSAEEVVEEATFGPGLYCISMVSDERKNLFGYCVNGELHVFALDRPIVGAFRSGRGVSVTGRREKIWSAGSVDGQQDWTIEVEWNMTR